ncbi:MAG: acyl-[ACP]--phospholipid O-acyltransferase [Acidobacteriota bacterium]
MDRSTGKHSLGSLLAAQFFGAFNDNAWKLLVVLLAIRSLERQGLAGADLEAASQLTTTWAFTVFTAPLMLFSIPAAMLADRVGKRTLILAVKVLEMILLSAGTLVLFAAPDSRLPLLVLGLMGAQSALFSPAKYAILPEILPHSRLSAGNGQLEMWTFLAIIAGTASGGLLLDLVGPAVWLAGVLLVVFSALGFSAAWRIPRVPPARNGGQGLATLVGAWRAIASRRRLGLSVVGLSVYWGIASLLGQDVLVYAKSVLDLPDRDAGLLLATFGLGVGAGCVLAGRWSGRKVELGLIPVGALFLSIFSLLFGLVAPGFGAALGLLLVLGMASGLLIIPLNAMLQWRSPPRRRGAVIALSNVFIFAGVLAGSLGAQALSMVGFSSLQIFAGASLLTFAGTAWALFLLPDTLLRFFLVVLTWTFYRLKVIGREHVPETGPALLVPNHVSFADGLFLLAALDRPIRFLVDADYADQRLLRPFVRALGAIPISSARGPRHLLRAFRRAGEELDHGHLVCIFPEGQITRTGTLQPFRRGLERIVSGRDLPLVPVNLDRVWGSIFSREGGRFLFKIPPQIPRRVTVAFGRPLPATTPLWEVRQAVHDLGRMAWAERKPDLAPLHRTFIRTARRHPFELALADRPHPRVSRIAALSAAVCLARALRSRWSSGRCVGVLLPASVAATLINIAASIAGRTVVNLNFTAGRAGLASAIRQAGIKTVVTSQEFMEKLDIDLPDSVEVVHLESIRSAIRRRHRLRGLLAAWLLPTRWLERMCGAKTRPSLDDLATVLFSSGSTGEPKGVMLSHFNVASNVESAAQIFPLTRGDRVLLVLPLFHAFGTMILWLALNRRITAIFHPNPLDAAAVGDLVQHYRVDFLPATPTFLRIWMRRCTPAQFGSLGFIMCGAEKLPERLARSFEDQFGIKVLEGYGATECSPVIAASTLDYRAAGFYQPGFRRGSVGQALPGVSVRIVDPDTFETLPPGQPGMLLVNGPNIMQGYLGRPSLTNQVMRDGWYVTGDIAVMDEEGFLRITDRLSRFSKIGGEMVPHRAVEEALQGISGREDLSFAVTAVPDARKGERLVVLHTVDPAQVPELIRRLTSQDLPNLYLPRAESFIKVSDLPVLGTGKLDLRRMRQIAAEQLGEPLPS